MKRIPKPISIRELEAEMNRYERACEKHKKALREYAVCSNENPNLEFRRLLAEESIDRQDMAAHRFAKMTARWLNATNPLRSEVPK